MNILGVAMTLIAGSAALAGETLTVCMNTGLNVPVLRKAQATASQIMKDAGVKLEWRSSLERCKSTARSILIELSLKTAEARFPGAFAYALPYEGSHIVVFYDRVMSSSDAQRTPLIMGHVLAHEITHILEGLIRHSESGLMKAKWDYLDHGAMEQKRLALSRVDVELIGAGLKRKLEFKQPAL